MIVEDAEMSDGNGSGGRLLLGPPGGERAAPPNTSDSEGYLASGKSWTGPFLPSRLLVSCSSLSFIPSVLRSESPGAGVKPTGLGRARSKGHLTAGRPSAGSGPTASRISGTAVGGAGPTVVDRAGGAFAVRGAL